MANQELITTGHLPTNTERHLVVGVDCMPPEIKQTTWFL